MNEHPTTILVSIVIPVFNEAGNVQPLIGSIVSACSSIPYEIVVVNDGSTDSTSNELTALVATVPHLKIINLKRNFGQTAALAAGIDAAQGDIIVPMDGDGQNDPADIPRIIDKLHEGYDVVSGWRKNRQDSFLSRRLPSIIANAIISIVTDVHLHDYGCTLKAYRRSIISNLQLAGEMHRFLPAWCVWQGGRVAEIEVNHHARIRGTSKYGIMRIFKVLIDLLTVKFFSGYLFKPNYLFSGSGFIFFILGILSGGLAIFDKLGPNHFPYLRIPLLLLAVFFGLVALVLILMGLMAELLVRLYFQVRHQKPYRLADE